MDDDYTRYRQRRGSTKLKAGMIRYLKALAGYAVGLWAIPRIVEAGSITASDGNLLTVLLGIWLTYRTALFLWEFTVAWWMMEMPPIDELAKGVYERVRRIGGGSA